jgi:hypothetical protein
MNANAREYIVYNGRMQGVRGTRPASKPFEDMSRLRKLTSITYLGHKMRSWVHHKDSRDTIANADDEEEIHRATMRQIISCEDLIAEFSKATYDNDDHRSSITTTRTSDSEASHFSHSFIMDDSAMYEPTKDRRWCLNCNKCYQRQLSHFEYYCGLDCKTAHRVRMAK